MNKDGKAINKEGKAQKTDTQYLNATGNFQQVSRVLMKIMLRLRLQPQAPIALTTRNPQLQPMQTEM